MKGISFIAIVLLALRSLLASSCANSCTVTYPDFKSRSAMMIDSVANWAADFTLDDFKASDDFEGGKYGAYPIMALFERGHLEKANEFAAQQLVGGAAMFREFTTMALYMEYHDLYDEALREKVKKNQLASNFFNLDAEVIDTDVSESHRNPRLGGASENHKLMYAAAAYLGGIAWPDEYPKEWFQIGYEHLMHWFDVVTSIGYWEEDSPTYFIHHLGPILSVADHAPEGSEMKKRATMVLDWYFASIAGEYLHGYWITPVARDHNPLYGLASSPESIALTWLMFGDASQVPNPHIYQPYRHWKATLHFAVSDYRVPEVLARIATDRDKPFVHQEYMAKNPMHPKEYCYLNSKYGMASILSEKSDHIPPNMTRWKVQWVVESPDKEPSVFLMKHPQNQGDAEKWRGASSAEQVLQYEDALIAVYNISEGEEAHIEGPFRKESFQAIERKQGWLFIHTGANLMAIRAINGLEISDQTRPTEIYNAEVEVNIIKSMGRKNGLIVQTAPLNDYSDRNPENALQEFITDVLTKTKIDASGIDDENPVLSYTSLSRDLLEIRFDTFKKVNGKDLEFDNWPLLGNPWMQQDYKGRILTIEYGNQRLVYDFYRWEIE